MIKTIFRTGGEEVAAHWDTTVKAAKDRIKAQTVRYLNWYGKGTTYSIDGGPEFWLADQHNVTMTRIQEGDVFLLMTKDEGPLFVRLSWDAENQLVRVED